MNTITLTGSKAEAYAMHKLGQIVPAYDDDAAARIITNLADVTLIPNLLTIADGLLLGAITREQAATYAARWIAARVNDATLRVTFTD